MSETVAQPPVGEDFCAVLVSVDDFMEQGFDVFVDDEIAPSIRFFDEGGVFAQPVSHLRLDGGDDGVGVDLFVGLGSVFGFTHGLLNLSWSEVEIFGIGVDVTSRVSAFRWEHAVPEFLAGEVIGHEEAHGLDVSGCESWGEGNAVLTGDDEGLRVPCEDGVERPTDVEVECGDLRVEVGVFGGGGQDEVFPTVEAEQRVVKHGLAASDAQSRTEIFVDTEEGFDIDAEEIASHDRGDFLPEAAFSRTFRSCEVTQG